MRPRSWLSRHSISFPHQLAIFFSVHVAGMLVGVTLLPLRVAGGTVPQPGGTTAAALFAANSKLVALTFLISAFSGGVAALLIVGVNGLRYGLALAVATPAVPVHTPMDQLLALVFPWLEFVALIGMAALGAAIFWRLWFSSRLLGARMVTGVCLLSVASLLAAAGMEARVLAA
jgi:hypothetical protein